MLFRSGWQQSLIRRITSTVVRCPRLAVFLASFLAVAAVILTCCYLEFRTSRLDLLNPSANFQKLWLAYTEEFGNDDEVVIVVEGSHQEDVLRTIDRLGQDLERHPELFRNVHYRFDRESLYRKGLHFLQLEEVQQIEAYVGELVSLVRQPQSDLRQWQGLIERITSETGPVGGPTRQSQTSSNWSQLIQQLITGDAAFRSPWPFRMMEEHLQERIPEYELFEDGQLGLITLHFNSSTDGFVRGSQQIKAIRSIIEDASTEHSDVQIGLTGLPIIEHDEMRISQFDMTIASIVSLVGVSLLFSVGFGRLKYPLSAVFALLVGIAWTCGYLTTVVGHLNILSMAFGVILIGLGIDFAIHYVARYMSIRSSGLDASPALVETSTAVGPAIIAGGLTTAAAFFATALTEFLGVAELGLIAGGGIVLCAIATMTVLPALLSRDKTDVASSLHSSNIIWDPILQPFWSQPRHTVIAGIVATVFLAAALPRVGYDQNLLNLQAHGIESVAWEHRLLDQTDRSAWYAVSIAENREQLEQRKPAFLELDSVERVEEIASLVPVSSHEKRAVIQRIHQRLDDVPASPPVVTPINQRQNLAQWKLLADSVIGLSDTPLGQLTDANQYELFQRIDLVRSQLLLDLWEQLHALRNISDPRPPELSDLPAAVRARFVGRHGKFAMRVYAAGDVWESDTLERFVKQIKSVDRAATGQPLQTYFASRQMRRSYVNAAIYSALAVITVLWWDLRRFDWVALAILPTVLGMVQLFGLMGYLQIPLNPANIIVLPLIIGIGIDDGIHVVHDIRAKRNPIGLSSATSKGIIMTSLTSMIGFGSLMLARHEGLRSLGRVVTLGITCCLLTSTLWLPCLLFLLRRKSRPSPAASTGPPASDDPPPVPQRQWIDSSKSALGSPAGGR